VGDSHENESYNPESDWMVQHIIFDYETKQGPKGKITDRQVKIEKDDQKAL